MDRRAALSSMAAGLLAATVMVAPAAHATSTFLNSTGGKGVLAQEEERLVKLRQEKESEAIREIEAERIKFEQEARTSQVGAVCC